ncbi:MAG: DUF177 domain-containing protein [Nitrospiria bacterium]
MATMSVRLSDIPVEGLSLDYRHDRHLLDPLGEGVSLLDDVDVSLRITPEDDRYFIQGDVTGRVQVECGRCLTPVALTVMAPCAVDALPLPAAVEGEDTGALRRGELEVTFYSGPILNLDDLVREQLLLNVPMRTLCREGCLGLCPMCGKNRNEGACGCEDSPPVDPRLEELRKLRG